MLVSMESTDQLGRMVRASRRTQKKSAGSLGQETYEDDFEQA